MSSEGSADVDQRARAIVDASRYMTLATADEAGEPWATPVWFAHAGYRDLLWVSDPRARHSRNVESRPAVGVVVFDSQVALGEGEGVYMAARAGRVSGDAELEAWVAAFSRRSVEQGGRAWGVGDVSGAAVSRLYRAVAAECWLGRRDERVEVSSGYFG